MKDGHVAYKLKDLDTSKYRKNGYVDFQSYGTAYNSLNTIKQMLAANFNNWIMHDWTFRNLSYQDKRRIVKLFKGMDLDEKISVLYSPRRVVVVQLIEQEI